MGNEIFKPGRSESGGFSLIEIMVVVGILVIINTMIFLPVIPSSARSYP